MRLLLLLFFAAFSVALYAQPINDACNSATLIPTAQLHCGGSTFINGTTVDGTDEGAAVGCFAPTDIGVWYTFTAEGPDISIIDQSGSGVSIAIFRGNDPCAPGAQVYCGALPTPTDILDNVLQTNDPYILFVAYTGGATDAFQLCIENWPDLPNQDLCTPDALGGGTVTASTYGTAYQFLGPCTAGSDYENAQVFEYMVPLGVYKIQVTLSSPDLGIGTALGIGEANAACTGLIGDTYCDENLSGAGFTAENFCVLPGDVVEIVVASSLDNNGEFTLTVTDVPTDNCNENEVCDVAMPIAVASDCQTVTTSDCNTDACPENFLIGTCDFSMGPAVWYMFTADGGASTVDISVDNDMVLGLVEACSFTAGFCGTDVGGVSELQQIPVTPGQTYYIIVADADPSGDVFELNVTVYPDLPQDDPCSNFISSGVTMGDNFCTTPEDPSFGNLETDCDPIQLEATAWYEIVVPPGTPAVRVTVSPAGSSPVSSGTVQIGTRLPGAGCGASVFRSEIEDCDFTQPVEFIGDCFDFSDSVILYVMVGTTSDQTGTYQIDVEFIASDCVDRDLCADADIQRIIEPVTPPESTPPTPSCVQGCTNYTCPEENDLGTSCQFSMMNTVWFRVDTDAETDIMNIELTPETSDWDPVIAMFSGDCNNLVNEPLGTNGDCYIETGGSGFALPAISIFGSTSYYIAVGSLDSQGGNFDLCISTEILEAPCVNSQNIAVIDRENPAPLNDTFCPGELITFEYDLSWRVDDPNVGNDCQWLQGLIPVFGNGWDLDAFDPTSSNLPNDWDWYEEGATDYNETNFRLSTYTEDGRLKLAHNIVLPANYNAANSLVPGTLMPAGWFAVTQGGLPGCQWPTDDPDLAYGAPPGGGGGGCGVDYTFSFTFTARVREDCSDADDMSVAIFTFSDGAIGCWEEDNCGVDVPALYVGAIECNAIDIPDSTYRICSGGQTNIGLNPSVPAQRIEYFVVSSGNVTGAMDGVINGPVTNASIAQTLVNDAQCDSQIVEYLVLTTPPPPNRCGPDSAIIAVTVYADIMLMDPPELEFCPEENVMIDLAPLICGGTGEYPSITWSDTRGNSGTGTTIDQMYDPGTITVSVNIEDDFGCTGTGQFDIVVRDTMGVEIMGVNAICQVDLPAVLTATHNFSPSSGPNFTYEWTLPDNSTDVTNDLEYEAFDPGTYILTIIDDFGCEVADTFELQVNPNPTYTLLDNPGLELCPGVNLIVNVIPTDPTNLFAWVDVPAGFVPAGPSFQTTMPIAGTYVFELEDEIGCTTVDSFEIVLFPTVMATSDTLFECNDGTGVITWDLTSIEGSVLQGSTAGSVDWYIDTALTMPIDPPTSFISGDTVVYAVARSNDPSECDALPVPVYLQFLESFTANDADQERCLEPTGIASFDLDALINDISGGNGTVEFYADTTLTNQITGNTADFESGDTIIYAIIRDDQGCVSNIARVVLTTEVSLTANNTSDEECLLIDGTATFDLTDLDGIVNGGASLTVIWYSDANFTQITDPTSFNVMVPTTIFAAVSDGTCASNLAEVDLTGMTTGPAGSGSLSTCDEGGQGTYDLVSNGDPIVLDGNTGTVLWYEDSGATIPVTDPSSYTTSNTTVYAILQNPDGCISDIMEIELTRGPLVAVAPDSLSECGSGTAVFDLTIRDGQISDNQIGRSVEWFDDAGATSQIANPDSYTSGTGTVYAVVVQGPCRSEPVPLNLIVTIDLPANAAALDACIQANGLGIFNLNDANDDISSNSTFIVRFYTDTSDLTDSLTMVSSYESGPATIFAIVFDGDCRSFAVPVTLTTSYQVMGTPGVVETECLENLNGQSTFDLDSYADAVSGGTDRTVVWYEDAATTVLATPTNAYVSGPTTLYVVITDAEGCISEPLAVDLEVNVALTAEPANISTCDIGGGVGQFDLTDYDDEVNGGVSSRTVTWYADTTAAPISDPTMYSASDGDVVFAIVSDGRCISHAGIYTLTIDNNLPANPATIQACDEGGTGVFNLENATATIIGSNPFSVEFYQDMALTNQITGANITAYNSAPGVIYAITLDGPCRSQPVEVTLELIPEIVAQATSDEACDDGSGGATFDLTTLEATIDNGQGFNVLWYSDAAATTPISDPTTYFSNGNSAWAVLTNGNCSSEPVEITFTIVTILANNAMALACDGGTGEGTFNLTNAEININSDGTLTVEWYSDAAATTPIGDPSSYVSGPGTVYAVVTDGTCSSPIAMVTLQLTESLPIEQVLIEGCDDGDGSLVFDLTTFEAVVIAGGTGDVIWYTDAGGTQIITDETSFESGTTTIYAQVVDEPCRSLVEPMDVVVNPLPVIDAGDDLVLTCDVTSLTLTASIDISDATIAWTTDDGSILTDASLPSIDVDAAGSYTLQVTNSETGCVETDVVSVTESADIPVADAGADIDLTCFEPTQSIGTANTTTGANISISWTLNGDPISGTDAIRSVSDTGTYVLTVINTDNNCENDDEVVVTSSIDLLSDVEFDVTNPTCNGAATGCVEFLGVIGGQAPYMISTDGETYQDEVELCNLSVGMHTLSIRDANGCVGTTQFEILDPEALEVSIQGDRLIDYNEFTTLTAIHTPAGVAVDTFIWSSDTLGEITLTQIANVVTATGLVEFDVAVQIIDENGCTAQDVITIFVRKDFQVYVPNAFSPGNKDNINDFFYVYGDEEIVTNVDLLQIYDRWGEKVYERTDTQVNEDRTHGWDGTFMGERMLPGVYAYVVQVTFVDGTKEELTGSFHLID